MRASVGRQRGFAWNAGPRAGSAVRAHGPAPAARASRAARLVARVAPRARLPCRCARASSSSSCAAGLIQRLRARVPATAGRAPARPAHSAASRSMRSSRSAACWLRARVASSAPRASEYSRCAPWMRCCTPSRSASAADDFSAQVPQPLFDGLHCGIAASRRRRAARGSGSRAPARRHAHRGRAPRAASRAPPRCHPA